VLNYVLSDAVLPFNIKADAMVTGKFVGKVAGKKTMQQLISFKGYGRIDKG